jgi:hypothetical protein
VTENTDRLRFLRIIMAAGGGYEMAMGLTMFFFIGWFFRLLGARDEIRYLMFPESLGVLALSFGLLLLLSSRDPERYLLVALASTGPREPGRMVLVLDPGSYLPLRVDYRDYQDPEAFCLVEFSGLKLNVGLGADDLLK